MTAIQIELVQNSWKTIAVSNAQLPGKLLCSQLLEIIPQVKSVFCYRANKIQPRKITALVSYIVRKLHRTNEIVDQVENLASRHLQYDVQDEQYIDAGKALLAILEACLGDKWNYELRCAWATFYTTVAEAVMNASRVQEEELAMCG